MDAIDAAHPGMYNKELHRLSCEVIAQGLKDLGLMKGDVKEAVELGAHALFMVHGLGHQIGLDVHDMEGLGQIYVGYDDTVRPSNIFGWASLRMARELKPGFVWSPSSRVSTSSRTSSIFGKRRTSSPTSSTTMWWRSIATSVASASRTTC